ncbi:hypothetical protein GOBAR_DD32389 [Gossypium barbadense]|nr:hypothetical protein GOBAR_DD32389 [Gossypium barbadense]
MGIIGNWKVRKKGKTCSDFTARGVEVHVDRLGWVFGFEEEELGHNDVGGVVVDGSVDADDPFLEETRENVVSPLAAGRVLDHHGYQAEGTGMGGHGGGASARNEAFGG